MRRRGFKCALGKSTNPPCAPSHVPYWSLREREQSPQNQRAKSPCYTSPIFSTSPTSRPHRVAQPQLSIPVIRCWRASLKRAGTFYCHYLISHPVIIYYPELFTPPSSLSHWNDNPHHRFFCLLAQHHLFRLCPVASSSFFALSLVPVISQGMRVGRAAGVLVLETRRRGSAFLCMRLLSQRNTQRPAEEDNWKGQFYSSQLSLTVPAAHWVLSMLEL